MANLTDMGTAMRLGEGNPNQCAHSGCNREARYGWYFSGPPHVGRCYCKEHTPSSLRREVEAEHPGEFD